MSNSTGFKSSRLSLAVTAAIAIAVLPATVQAIGFGSGDWRGSWDTTVSYGASWRIADRCDDCVGKVQLNPFVGLLPLDQQIAAPGRFSINNDNGNLNYDDGDLVSHAIKVTTEVGFSYKENFGGFFRLSGFYDFENNDADFLVPLTGRFGDARDYIGEDIRMLDAYLYYDFDLGEHAATVRLGRQVISWGESTFIQGGINVINAVDVSKLRVAGAELKEVFLPLDMIWTSIDITQNLALEALYMFEFEQVDTDPNGSFFSTNDFGVIAAEYVMLGFGLAPEQTPGLTIARQFDRNAKDSGQFGLALRYYAPWLGDTEFGLYYLNYHSRLPLLSGRSVTDSNPESGQYFVEYPEGIDLIGLSFNTEVAGMAWQGEVSYRDNQPLQFDDVELLFAALTPLNGAIPAPVNQFQSQLGQFGFGEFIQGWETHEVTQVQTTLTKIFGSDNPFKADQWVLLSEVGLVNVWDLPDKDVIRYNGPGTDTGGGTSADTGGGNARNPVTESSDGFPDEFSWGYRFITRLDYNSAFGSAINLFPRLAFNHDVGGTSPGPAGNFIEGRKSLTLGLNATYLEKWSADVSYTSFWGAGRYNLLRDRDFASFNVRYSF